MMNALEIRRMKTRYRLPAREAAALRRRLDGIFATMLDAGLEAALERAGVRGEEEVCVRRVRAAVRLSARRGDAALGADWSAAIVEAIGEAIERHPADDIVRYGSRMQAWIDFAQGVARGDLRRAWAWRQAGVSRCVEDAGVAAATLELVRALVSAPQMVVAVLVALARTGWAGELARRLDEPAWTMLAAAALEAHGVTRALLAPSPTAHDEEDIALLTSPGGGRTRSDGAARARQVLERSPLISVGACAELRTAMAIAVLVHLAYDPGLARRGPAHVRSAVVALAEFLLHEAPSNAVPGVGPQPQPENRAAAAALRRTPVGTGGAARPRRMEAQETVPPPRAPDDPAVRDRARAAPPALGERSLLADGSPADDSPAPAQSARTEWGGLMYLLNLLASCGIAEPGEPALASRTLRWTLHRLASELVPVAPADPAALAFAGLAPSARPPAEEEPPAQDAELAAVAALAARVVERLREVLDAPSEPRDALVRRVCWRPAELVADPGWIEVRFELESLSTEIRRAGLDLHPGWLPWLGAVVRFVYD